MSPILSLMALSTLFLACEQQAIRGELSPRAPTTVDALTLEVEDTAGEAMEITWTVNGKAKPAFDGFTQIDADQTEKGETWEATVQGSGRAVSFSTVIRNSAPTATGVIITPEEPGALDTLTCTPEGFQDADNDPVGWAFLWWINDIEVHDGPSLEPGQHQMGDRVKCRAWPVDGEVSGQAVGGTVAVRNSPPSIDGVQILPEMPTTETELSFTAELQDIDGQSLSTTAEWRVNGALVHTGPTLAASYFERDDEVAVTVSPNDGSSSGPAAQTRVEIQNASPTLDSVRFDPASPNTTDRVVAEVQASDPDGDTLWPIMSWWVNGEQVSEGPSMPAGAATRGQTVVLRVEVGDGQYSEHGERQLTLVNAPPSEPAVQVTPGNGAVAGLDDLVCELDRPAVDPDGDTVSYNILWSRNGMPWLGLQSDSILPGDTVPTASLNEGDLWTCGVTASDGPSSVTASASQDVLTCTSDVEVFVATASASVDPDDGSLVETTGITADEDSEAWAVFDLSTLPERSFIFGATLSMYVQEDGLSGSPSLEVMASPAVGWSSSSPAIGPNAGVESVETSLGEDTWAEFDLNIDTWSWEQAVRNQGTSLALSTGGAMESSAQFYGADTSGKEPILTLSVTRCE